MKKGNLLDFVAKSNEIHSSFYNYSKFEYFNSSTKGVITCPIHGDFLQTPTGHLSGKGCRTCGYLKNSNKRALNEKDFIERCLSQYPDNEFDFSITKFINTSKKVEVICKKHGIISMNPQNLLRGMSCRKCAYEKSRVTVEDFYSTVVLPDNISLIEETYVSYKEVAKFSCSLHGNFEYVPSNIKNKLFSICPMCSKLEQDYKLEKLYAKKISDKFGDTISVVSKTYDSTSDTATLYCKIHGEFSEKASIVSKRVSACPFCSKEMNLRGRNSVGGFNKTRALRGDFSNKGGYLYLLKIEIDSNVFYKIGVTGSTINKRISRIKQQLKRSKIELIDFIYSKLEDVILMESFIKKNFLKYSIVSKYEFGGKTELFSVEILKTGEGLTNLLEDFL